MKIRVKFEKEYDSEEFYSGFDQEERAALTFEQFKEGIVDEMFDYTNEIIDLSTFELVD
jgi:hypothetical protein